MKQRATFSFQFYVRESKTNSKGYAHIELGISLNGRRQFINLPMSVTPKEFNSQKRPAYIDDYISGMRVRINEILSQMVLQREPLTLENLKSYIRTGGVKSYTVNDLTTDYMKTCVARDMEPQLVSKYRRTCQYLKDEVGPASETTAITQQAIARIESIIRKNYAPATACGYLTKLKSIIRFGIDNNRLQINPCQNLKIGKPKTKPEILSVTDFNSIKSKDFSFCPRVEKVRDLFLFACGSGLAYIDVSNLQPQDFKEVDGTLCVTKTRHKTGVEFCSVLLPWAAEIARKYDYNLKDVCISNQKLNLYCKEIQAVCGVNSVKSLHFHLARHFYAQTLLDAGVDIHVLQKAGGWSNSKIIFQHYARLKDATVVENIIEKLNIAL